MPLLTESPTLPDGPMVQAVGESFHRDAFISLFGLPRDWRYFENLVAELVPEPGNVHDSAAVAVHIAGRKVGHLSREDARSYRTGIDEAISLNGRATVHAEVRCAPTEETTYACEFGVFLRFSDRPTTVPPPEADEVRLAEGGSVSVSNEEHYQPVLAAATNNRDVSWRPYVAIATLVRADAGNPWIKKPTGPLVAVQLGPETVGYFTRAMTDRYLPFVDDAAQHGKRLTAAAFLKAGMKAGQPIIEITLNAVPRRSDQDTIESLAVEVTAEMVIDRRTGTVHRLAGQRPDGSWETSCATLVTASPEDLIGTTTPWVGRVEMASGRIYDDRLPYCERC